MTAIEKAYNTRKTGDNMPVLLSRKATRDNLAQVFADIGYTDGVEVGTKWGTYAITLCKENPNLHLKCVDPYVEYARGCRSGQRQSKQDIIWDGVQKAVEPYNITLVKEKSMVAVDQFRDWSLDFVYIDADHRFDQVMMDIIRWSEKVRKGGIVACHDYRAGHWAGVVKAIDAYTHCHAINPWFVTREAEPTAFWVRP